MKQTIQQNIPAEGDGSANYLATLRLLEQLRANFTEMLEAELFRLKMGHINSTQAMLLYQMDEDEVTLSELLRLGRYVGTNVSYNVRILERAKLVALCRGRTDRRSMLVSLTDEGLNLRAKLDAFFVGQSHQFSSDHPDAAAHALTVFRGLGQFWAQQARISSSRLL